MLTDFLEAVTVPYLYSIGSNNVVFDMLSTIPDEDLFVGIYHRTSNEKQIDGIFEAKLGNSIINICCECKNRASIIYSTELLKILIKTEMHSPKLTFVFCTAFAVKPKVSGKLYLHCWEKGIQIYRILASEATAQLVPFFGDAPMPSKVTSICILLESYRINQLI